MGVEARGSHSKDTLAIAAQGAQGVQGRGRKLVSKGEKNNTQALAASKSNQVAGFSFLGKLVILTERKREAVPPMPMALTVLGRM